jgi:hypothetical protein
MIQNITNQRPPLALQELHKGVILGFTSRNGYYDSAEATAHVDRMAECGVRWVGVAVTMWQESYASTRVFADFERTCNHAELERIIARIRGHGMKVMLYLCLELFDGVPRWNVGFPKATMAFKSGRRPYKEEWFASYTACCVSYAQLCERTGAEMLCLGAEYDGTVAYDAEWTALVGRVRDVFSGAVAYEAHVDHIADVKNHPGLSCPWFNLLDLIGFSFYRPGSDQPGASKDAMVEYLKSSVEVIRTIAERTGKPVLFTECGCRSRHGGAMVPWDFEEHGRYDGEEQANYLRAVIETFQYQPFWQGLYWWKWDELNKDSRPHYYTDPAGDMGFEMYGKPASHVFRDWNPERTN